MSLTQYCLFINTHVGKAVGQMFNPPTPIVKSCVRLWHLTFNDVVHSCYTKPIASPVARLNQAICTAHVFSQPVTMSVAVSKMGVTQLIFVDPGFKINSQ